MSEEITCEERIAREIALATAVQIASLSHHVGYYAETQPNTVIAAAKKYLEFLNGDKHTSG